MAKFSTGLSQDNCRCSDKSYTDHTDGHTHLKISEQPHTFDPTFHRNGKDDNTDKNDRKTDINIYD